MKRGCLMFAQCTSGLQFQKRLAEFPNPRSPRRRHQPCLLSWVAGDSRILPTCFAVAKITPNCRLNVRDISPAFPPPVTTILKGTLGNLRRIALVIADSAWDCCGRPPRLHIFLSTSSLAVHTAFGCLSTLIPLLLTARPEDARVDSLRQTASRSPRRKSCRSPPPKNVPGWRPHDNNRRRVPQYSTTRDC